MSPLQEVPTFYPTLKEVRGSFEDYILSIEDKLSQYGICRIIPPREWKPQKNKYTDFHVARPIKQHATGRRGVFRTFLVEGKPLSVEKDFAPVAKALANQPQDSDDPSNIEREFWKKVTYSPPTYCADVMGTLFGNIRGWNISCLDSLLSRTLISHNIKIPGVNSAYLYFGMWRSFFAWHTEDADLYSVNYIHYGAPKYWYAITPKDRKRFEILVQGMLPELWRACPQFLRHKEIMISPSVLHQNGIEVVKTIQRSGEFIVTYPGSYHCGFNCGFNCAESTNFATEKWVKIGKSALWCTCSPDSVRIDMSLFDKSKKRKAD
jgi:[histone H3]-trimethyl-L-lysine9/36 demethylase